MEEQRKNRRGDPIQPAKVIGDIATGQTQDAERDSKDLRLLDLGGLVAYKGRAARAHSSQLKGPRKSLAKRLKYDTVKL